VTATALIVNPASASGRTARQWPEIARRAGEIGLDVEVRLTEGPGHAGELARQAVDQGAELILAVGGDGTVSETAAGMLEAADPLAADLAVVCRGSGCDLIRTFGIPKDTDAALEIAKNGTPRLIDAGRISFTGPDGGSLSRHFVNVASAGMTGIAADRVNRSGKPLGATVAFAWAAVATFVGYRNTRFVVEIDGRRLEQVCNNVIVANCRYFAGGMKILPQADPSDGMFDVLVWGDISKVDLALNLHKLYRGSHVSHPKARIERARMVTVTPELSLPIEVDGEQPGLTPATFEVVPSALRLRVPAA
jgi:YegS/Rv2252/BmrU family lipid kinase